MRRRRRRNEASPAVIVGVLAGLAAASIGAYVLLSRKPASKLPEPASPGPQPATKPTAGPRGAPLMPLDM